MTFVAGQFAAFVHEADITDARSDIGQLPGLAARLVVGPGSELPGDRCRILDASHRHPALTAKVAGRQCGLADDLRDNPFLQEARF